MNPQYRTKTIAIYRCRKCHKDFDNYEDASKCCTEDEHIATYSTLVMRQYLIECSSIGN